MAAQVVKNLSRFAEKYKELPCLAYTHLQPAQLTTVGKRATLYIYELTMDIENLSYQLQNLKLLGQKGTTGTQASFMELFSGDENKVKELERLIAQDMGFSACVPGFRSDIFEKGGFIPPFRFKRLCAICI